MRTLCTVLTLVAALAVTAKLQADDKVGGNAGKEAGPVAGIQDLNLTDDQEAKIADIRKECRPKVREAAGELANVVKEEVEKIRGTFTAEQKEKVDALKAHKQRRVEGLAARLAHLGELDLTDAEMTQIADIRKEYRPRMAKALTVLQDILTDEQKKSREEALKAGKKRREVLESLNLTDEQKEKVAAVCKEVATLVREELDKIRDVLTEAQQAKLPELKDESKQHIRDRLAARIANLSDLNLTDDQKSQIAAIRTEYRPKVQEAGNKLRAAVREEVGSILAIVKG